MNRSAFSEILKEFKWPFTSSVSSKTLDLWDKQQSRFSITASSLLAWLLVEVLLIWLCLYLLAVVSQLKWLDIFAYCGYKYVR